MVKLQSEENLLFCNNNAKEFQIDSNIIDMYMSIVNAPIVRIADALTSPKKRRLSLKGKVTQKPDLQNFPNSTKLNLLLNDGSPNVIKC